MYIYISKFVSVSHNKSQFTKAIRKTNGVRLAGTQQIDRTWFHVKKSIPKSLNNRKAGWLNETDIMKYVWIFVWRKNCHKDMYKALGNLCRKHLWTKLCCRERKEYCFISCHAGHRNQCKTFILHYPSTCFNTYSIYHHILKIALAVAKPQKRSWWK